MMCALSKEGKFDFGVVSGVDSLVLYLVYWGGGGACLEKEKKLAEGGASHKSGK
jgi:hypothetical protein